MFRKRLVLLLALAFVSSLSTFVFADDSSTGGYNWTGPYVGLNAGWAKANAKSKTTTTFDPTRFAPNYLWDNDQPGFDAVANPTLRSDNFVGGIQGGYNRQFGNFVLGGEIDFNYMNIKNSETLTAGLASWSNTPATLRSSIDIDWLLTVRPRIGYAFQNFLFYGTGGLALTDVRARWAYWHQSILASESASKSKTKLGWTLGGGIEVGLWKNWSVKGEYLYSDFGKVSSSGIVRPFGFLPQAYYHKVELKTQILRFGLNYRF